MKGCATTRFIGTPGPAALRMLRRVSRLGVHLAAHLAAVAMLLLSMPAHAYPWQQHDEVARPHPAMRAGARSGFQPRNRQQRPGREHLREWYQNHQHMNAQQQENALRRQPGFNRLSPAQQQRMVRRLRMLNSQPPAVRARMMARNEAFEKLSPERQQEVRAAAQAFQHMPQYRKQELGRAFHILRTLPPDERTAILHSARFQAEYTPRERHVLSNLLSIEPWQQQQQPPLPAQPHR